MDINGSTKQLQVGLLVIATGKYNEFLGPLTQSIEDHFMKNHEVIIHLFTDEPIAARRESRLQFKVIEIPSYKFPEATLLRYQIFSDAREKLEGDYLFYLDVDSLFVGNVGEEILIDGLTVTCHPGFYRDKGWGDMETKGNSIVYTPPASRVRYYCGGFQGGSFKDYLEACVIMAQDIKEDKHNGVMARWHDESHWNHYINVIYSGYRQVLTPEYMMPEQQALRKAWKIDHFEPKILALSKNHKEIRA
jgi:hypothetical protein